jgi:NADH dehydrogenase FAD-containing subunit
MDRPPVLFTVQPNGQETDMKHRILVLGAGYAGASAAGRIARRLRRDSAAITLVNAESDFVERVRMHQLAIGQDLPRHDLASMFEGSGVELRLGRVAAVDADTRAVTLDDGERIPYDILVYALGSTAAPSRVPGVAEYAHNVSSRPAALRLRERLAELGDGAPVVVVGGGLTGIEAATEFAETRPDLTIELVTRGEFGGWLSPKGRAHLRKVFERLGIGVEDHATVERVEPDAVVTTERPVTSAATVWAGGFAVHPIAAASGLEVTETGQIVVDDTMRSVSHPEVYAVGDAAYALGQTGAPLRMSCASGVPTAWLGADAVASRLTGRGKIPRTPLRYYQQCVSLGREDGLIQFVTADDQAKPSVLTGRKAARYKEMICKGAVWAVAHPLPYPARRRDAAAAGTAIGSIAA